MINLRVSIEGASKESIKGRQEYFSDCFWILENDDKEVVSFINGMLTHRENLLGFYSQFGFVNEGISTSTHGDVVWYQMRMEL